MAALAVLPVLAGAAKADFQLGLQDNGFSLAPSTPASVFDYRTLQAVDGTTVRLELPWASVAPPGQTRPSNFNPANPADPRYSWASVDTAVKAAAGHHARVMLDFTGAPQWSQPPGRPASLKPFPGAWDPSATDFATFARAAAVRYSGHFPDPVHPGAKLPRVAEWEIWNEENLPYDLAAPNLVEEYRSLLNGSYAAIKAVNRENVVAVGGLAPVSFVAPLSISPLKFAAELFCLRRVGTRFERAGSCLHPAHFDVFADHPYSVAATPTKHAYRYDDVLIGDMEKIAAVVHAADTLHTVAPRIHHRIWVTEWSWFTNPPDLQVGDSPQVAARYTAYSMYEMWRAGVSLVIWFSVRDTKAGRNSPALVYGGGLHTVAGREKPMMRAFLFPVIAAVSNGQGLVWGRAPISRRVGVEVQLLVGHTWEQVTAATTASDGVFEAHFAARGNGIYRASVPGGPTSRPYDSRPIPPQRTHLFDSG